MNQGRRYIGNSVIALLAVTVLLAAISRLYASTVHENTPQWLRRVISLGLKIESQPVTQTKAPELLDVRNLGPFTGIRAEGDFAVEVIAGPAHKVTLERADGGQGWNIDVESQKDGVLRFSRAPGSAGDVLRIEAPVLTSIQAHGLRYLTIRGWKAPEFTLRVKDLAEVRLEDTAVERWIIHSESPVVVHADKATTSAGLKIHASGQISLRAADNGKIEFRGTGANVTIQRNGK
jgi:hypothetical protein